MIRIFKIITTKIFLTSTLSFTFYNHLHPIRVRNIKILSSSILSILDEDNSPLIIESESNFDGEAQIGEIRRSINKSIELYSRKATSLKSEYEKAQEYEKMMHKANLITANLFQITPTTSSIIVADWENDNQEIEISFDIKKYGSAQEEANALFTKARKMKRGSAVIQELLKKNEEDLDIFAQALKQLELLNKDDEEALKFFQTDLQKKVKSKSLKFSPIQTAVQIENNDIASSENKNKQQANKRKGGKKSKTDYFRRFLSQSGHRILVGKNRHENEKLCFRVAKSKDIWLHARNVPGAHVLICVRPGDKEPSQEDIQFAANLAAFYSENRREMKTDVTLAQPRHILKPRNAPPGAVKLRQEIGTVIGNPFEVPEDLKKGRGDDGVEVWSPISSMM